jgi:hypothetical protein
MHRQARGRVQRFLRRVDRYLDALDDDARRRGFLDRQVDDWERRYARFLATDGVSEPVCDPADPPHAADFLLTIAALAKRRNSLSRGDRMPQTNRHTDLHRAILALLVAADQRCPSIIGHAHLLYHADGSSLRFDSAQAVAQIKADAQDLLDAIARAESALRTTSFNTHPADSGRSS